MAKPNNYILNMINQRGEDWILTLKPEEIQYSAKRIVRDMVKGTINYQELGNYFLDLKFLENLIIGIQNELQNNTLHLDACNFFYMYQPNYPNLGTEIIHLQVLNRIYSVVLDKLNSIKFNRNIGVLADISGMLFSERNHLN